MTGDVNFENGVNIADLIHLALSPSDFSCFLASAVLITRKAVRIRARRNPLPTAIYERIFEQD